MISERRPCHLVARAGDSRSLCGQGSNRNPATPAVLVCWAPAHVAGYGRQICLACLHAEVRS